MEFGCLSVLAVMLISMVGNFAPAESHETPAEIEINVANWNKDKNIENGVDVVVLDHIMQSSVKRTIPVTNSNKRLGVNLYSTATVLWKKLSNLGVQNLSVRVTEVIFSWVPLGTGMGGMATMLLVDKRQTGKQRIKGQITFKPDRPVVAVFYQNYYVVIDDIKEIDFEMIVNGINMKKGSFGEVSLTWKTACGSATIYKPKSPVVFYLDPEEMPELEAQSSESIMKAFVKKAKDKREKELEYFREIMNFVDTAVQPVNYAKSDLAEIQDTIKRRIKLNQEYIKNLEENIPNHESLNDLRETLGILETRKLALENSSNPRELDDNAIIQRYVEKPEPRKRNIDY
ncbi:putative movement protein [Perilla mosaic virus]|uniref:Putative movement protein n=2 Tax=Emaravirus perillae TaxID=2845802 RepID=A0A6F8PH46_9VIRU|nr:putative movement protein [Perilla mosaic virus]BBM96181.1 putative movement protein [Perilla mosaic virus]BDH47811.1 putative movement protein [Emaravirus perillae]BDP45125.1 putative movement protein [Perilla mosaic virus]